MAAFVIDALLMALALVLPGSLASYSFAWFGGSTKAITLVWWAALLVLILGILLRDGLPRGSWGKRLFGLKIETRSGQRCSYLRSVVRNLPVLVPVWNLIEVYLVIFSRSGLRTGDRIAGTRVTEE